MQLAGEVLAVKYDTCMYVELIKIAPGDTIWQFSIFTKLLLATLFPTPHEIIIHYVGKLLMSVKIYLKCWVFHVCSYSFNSNHC